MAQERVNIFTGDGLVSLVVDVPDEYVDPTVRPAFSAGYDAGIGALYTALFPEASLTQAGEEQTTIDPVARERNVLIEQIAESILWQNRSADHPGVDWPGDLYDAKRIVEAVLDALGQ